MAAADRILLLIKTGGPLRTAEVAAALGLTPQGARQRLERLAADGLVDPRDERRGVGRPRRVWSLTGLGQARFPDAHAQLTLELIAAVRQEFGEAGLERLVARREQAGLRAYAEAVEGAASLRERVERLAEARTAEGYMAEVREAADGLLLIENHCPICAAASVCQGFCRSELDAFRRTLGPDCSVERTSHILAGARRCAYRVTPRAAAS
ncbi:MAG: MarR family transcriptional regulator [Caulobacteraceae bacterium]|nr:MarR family transcriptional regulator [Caulobacteraceae bacterium]